MNPDNWPSTPLGYYIMENPWVLWGSVAVSGVLLFLQGVRREKKKLKLLGSAMCVLSLLVMLAAVVITTDREVMSGQTRLLVNAAVSPVRIETFRRLLSQDVTLFDRDYDYVIASLERASGRWEVEQAWIANLLTHRQDGSHGRTYISLITRGQSGLGGGSIQTRWLLHWRKESDGHWRVIKIEWISLGDSPATPGDLP